MDLETIDKMKEIADEYRKIDEMLEMMTGDYTLDILVDNEDSVSKSIVINKSEGDEASYLDSAVIQALKERRNILESQLKSRRIDAIEEDSN